MSELYEITLALSIMVGLSISKLRLVNILVTICHIINVCLSQTIAKEPSTFVSIKPNMSNALPLVCHSEQCRGAVHLAVQCYGEEDCLGWIYDKTGSMSCLLCQCSADLCHFNRHGLVAPSALRVLDTPRIEKGMQNQRALVSLICPIIPGIHWNKHPFK